MSDNSSSLLLRFTTCMADPPWKERGGGRIKRGADRHYPLMSTDNICALPVDALLEANAHLYLWVTNRFLRDGLEVMRAWGFKYVTNIPWGKVKNGKVQQGLGQYFRGARELLLFGLRGWLPYRMTPDGKRAQHPSLVLAPRGKHSEKPEVFRQVVEKVSRGPYVELFARQPAAGWAVWSNESSKHGSNCQSRARDRCLSAPTRQRGTVFVGELRFFTVSRVLLWATNRG